MLSLEEARELVRIGRLSVLRALEGKEPEVSEEIKDRFRAKRGVFTTLLTYPERELRGCVGVPYPVYPLWLAVIRSSLSAAFKDPRFPPIRADELSRVVWELSILTDFEELPKEDLPKGIRVGLDGLMVEERGVRGLLLPQVAPRYGWGSVEFLEHTCLKAGLPKDCWRDEDVKVFRFQSEIFEEEEPWGEVKRVEALRCG